MLNLKTPSTDLCYLILLALSKAPANNANIARRTRSELGVNKINSLSHTNGRFYVAMLICQNAGWVKVRRCVQKSKADPIMEITPAGTTQLVKYKEQYASKETQD